MIIDNLEEIKDIKKNLPELANYCINTISKVVDLPTSEVEKIIKTI